MYVACVYDAANFVLDILLMGGAAAAGANRGTMGLGCISDRKNTNYHNDGPMIIMMVFC